MNREHPVQAAVPADLNTPDKVLYGLTARQLAILAGTGALLWLTYHLLAPFVPPITVMLAAIPIGALAAAVALGRRDGLPMESSAQTEDGDMFFRRDVLRRGDSYRILSRMA